MKREGKLKIIDALTGKLIVTCRAAVIDDKLYLIFDRLNLPNLQLSAHDLKIIVNTSTFTEMMIGVGTIIFIFNIADDPNLYG